MMDNVNLLFVQNEKLYIIYIIKQRIDDNAVTLSSLINNVVCN